MHESMKSADSPRRYDLEDRTFRFAQSVRAFVRRLPRTLSNIEDAKQLVRASGSVGANYIEANEALSKKDFVMRIKICRKEAKESGFFLRLLYLADDKELEATRAVLVQEATELTSIFGSIVRKSE
jgi:four helix bundle protein